MNIRVDEENGIAVGAVKGRAHKFQRVLSNGFWKNIGCLILDSTFGIGRLRLWGK